MLFKLIEYSVSRFNRKGRLFSITHGNGRLASYKQEHDEEGGKNPPSKNSSTRSVDNTRGLKSSRFLRKSGNYR